MSTSSEAQNLEQDATTPTETCRRGFTLIELMIVVVIVSILTAIAIPKFRDTKGKANAASLKADLRNLMTAEEAYFYDFGSYTTDTSMLKARLSSGVQLSWGTVNAGGWSAKVTHPEAYPIECAVFFGGVAALAPAVAEGNVRCQ